MTEVETIPPEYRGWWRITETSQWSSKFLDDLGPALSTIPCLGVNVGLLIVTKSPCVRVLGRT